MNTTEAFLGLDCTVCDERFDASEPGRCPDCGAPLDPVYDYDALDLSRGDFSPRPRDGVWDVDALLPLPADDAVTVAEGGTPLVEAPSLADELGVGRVVVKDEGRNPTGTVLDRGSSVAVSIAKEHGASDVAVASPGNGAQSIGSYAGRAGMRPHSFTPSRSTFLNKAMVNVHGGEMRVIGGRFDAAREAMDDQWMDKWYLLQEFTTPYRHEGIKTAAYEIAAGLDWQRPDAVVVPTGNGEVLVGLWKGFRELRELDLVDEIPPLYAAQPDGCAPIATAWEAGNDDVEPWATPDTICGELEISTPAGGALALDALEDSDGGAVTADDEDALESAVIAGQHEAMEMSVNGGIAAAGAWDLVDDRDEFDDDATIVLLNNDAGVKTADLLRSHLMGQGI